MPSPLYLDDALVTEHTLHAQSLGVTILQIWLLGHTPQSHVSALLSLSAFKPDSHILDIACGTGAVAALMAQQRPDLRFSLQNISPGQFSLTPHHLPAFRGRYLGDFTTLSNVPSSHFDGAQLHYALGHTTDLPTFFLNAARILKPGSPLFLYDLQPLPSNEQWAWSTLGYHTHTRHDIQAASSPFFTLQTLSLSTFPRSLSTFSRVCPSEAAECSTRTVPVCYRLTKTL